MKVASVHTFALIQTAMYWNAQALTQFSDHNVNRYEYGTDYTVMDSMEGADHFCRIKGFKLATIDEICPDGPGNPPVGGAIDGKWGAVHDDVDRWVSLGPGDNSCKGFVQVHGSNPTWWGRPGDIKQSWHNNQVHCSTATSAPTPNPTAVPTAAPTPKATVPVKDAVGDGCKNSFTFSSKFVASSGNLCNACSLCEGSQLNAIFDPSSQGICVDCAGIEDRCDQFEVMTTFDNEWVMKYISLSSSHAGSEYDPQTITMEFFKEDEPTGWYELSQETLEFKDRKEAKDYPFDNGLDKKYKQYKVTFSMKDNTLKMHIGHYAIISLHTKTCVSNILEDVTGKCVKPHKITI